jgi:hypothetical protein
MIKKGLPDPGFTPFFDKGTGLEAHREPVSAMTSSSIGQGRRPPAGMADGGLPKARPTRPTVDGIGAHEHAG